MCVYERKKGGETLLIHPHPPFEHVFWRVFKQLLEVILTPIYLPTFPCPDIFTPLYHVRRGFLCHCAYANEKLLTKFSEVPSPPSALFFFFPLLPLLPPLFCCFPLPESSLDVAVVLPLTRPEPLRATRVRARVEPSARFVSRHESVLPIHTKPHGTHSIVDEVRENTNRIF